MAEPQLAKFSFHTSSLHFAPPNLATQISEAPWPLFSEMLNGDFRNGGKLDLEFKGLVVS